MDITTEPAKHEVASDPHACLHCGLPIPESLLKRDGRFCCAGCETVYSLLQGKNMDTYYQLKRSSPSFRPASPVSSTRRNYDYLDKADTLSAYAVENPNRMTFYLEGVHCVACLWLVEKVGDFVPGVVSARLNIGSSQLVLQRSDDGSFAEIAATLESLGYRPHPLLPDAGDALAKKEHRLSLIRLGVAAACAGNIMLFSLALYVGVLGEFARWFTWGAGLLLLPSLLFSAQPFYRGAWGALRRFRMNIDVPVALALILGGSLSYLNLWRGSEQLFFDSVSTFIFLLLGTRHFFKYTAQQLNQDRLLQAALIPIEATLVTDSGIETVLSESLQPGDCVEVDVDDVLPADGELISAQAYVDTHVLTGESVPVHMKKGADVFAGMRASGQSLRLKVTKSGEKTRVGQLLTTIQQQPRPKLVELADEVSKWFLMVTLGLGAMLLAWDIYSTGELTVGVDRFLALIILACPCALSLATPLTYALAVKRAAALGVCLNNADFVERMAEVRTVVLDKTGTLTTGQLTVHSWEPLADAEGLLAVAASLERDSRHPVARAIVRYVAQQGYVADMELQDWEEISGVGVKARQGGVVYEMVSAPDAHQKGGGLTCVSLIKDGEVCGTFALGDTLLPDSSDVVSALHDDGFETVLLSGDHRSVVQSFADQLHIATALGAQGPEAKASYVEDRGEVIMVGDGANDALALKSAQASVAVQGSLQVSLAAADVSLTVPGLGPLPGLIRLAAITRGVVRQNFVLALSYNGAGILLVIGGWINPLIAAILMPLSSLTVLANAVRALRSRV